MQKRIIDGRSYPHEVLEHYRFRSIELYKEGKKICDIAHFLGVHWGSVSRWITTYKRHGKKALKSKKAPGPPFKLEFKDFECILKILKEDALQYGFETPLWTCRKLQQVIKKKINKDLDISNVWRLLVRLGLTNQKPKRHANQRKERAVKRWLKEEWPKIKIHSRRWQAMLYFLDEAGVSLTPVLGKTWAPKGKTPVVKVTGKRGGLCVSSAISPAGRMVFRIEKSKVNSITYLDFLLQIIRQHQYRKIIIIADRAPPHTAKIIEEFVLSNKNHIAIYSLPPYAPDLNPDEHVWSYLKAYQLKTHQAQTTDELKHLVKRKMYSIQRNKRLINSFFISPIIT